MFANRLDVTHVDEADFRSNHVEGMGSCDASLEDDLATYIHPIQAG